MVWGLAYVLAALLIGSGVIYVAEQMTAQAPQEVLGPAQTNATTTVSKPVSGSDWAAAYVLKLGGDKAVEAIKSASFLGTLTTGGQTYSLEILKKTPNLVRIQLENKEGTLMLGSDGHQAWVAYRDAAGNVGVWDADDTTRDWLWLQSPLGTWLAHPNAIEPKFVAEQPTAQGAGPPMQPVSVVSPGGRKATYYLDAGDLMPRELELHDIQPGAAAEVADLEDVRVQQDIRLPYKLEVRGPNGPAATVEIKKVLFNSGILNAVFDRPLADDHSGSVAQSAASAASSDNQDGQGMSASFNNDFDANAMRVHNFVAQTNVFQNEPTPKVESGSGAGAPKLADFGFPWPLPW
jgi:hypothetical protein